MRRYSIMVMALVSILAINSSWAAPDGPLAIAKYFPPGPLVFARTPNLKSLLPGLKGHPLAVSYLGSADDKQFRKSKLYLKLRDRFKDVEKLSGFGISFDNLLEVAGEEAALALYDIGELKIVFLSAVPREKVLKSKLFAAREKFEERRMGEQVYRVVTDDHGAAFAFAMIGRWLLVSNDLGRFEQSLSLLHAEQTKGSLADSDQFTALLPRSFQPGDLTLVLDQEALNDDLYFSTYWVHQNVDGLKWIAGEILDLKLDKGFIGERRWYLVDEETPGAPVKTDIAGLAHWPKGAGWIDVRPINEPANAASMIVRWVMGDTARDSGKTIKELAKLIAPSKPTSVASLDASVKNGLWLERRRLVAIKFDNPKAFDKKELLKFVARRWNDRLGPGGLLDGSFSSRDGVDTLNLPLLGGIGPSIYQRGSLLIISNDTALIREFLAAPAAPGFTVGASTYAYAELNKSAGRLADFYRALANRSNWRYVDSETFFRAQAPALLGTVGGVQRMTISGRMEEGRFIQEARYELVK